MKEVARTWKDISDYSHVFPCGVTLCLPCGPAGAMGPQSLKYRVIFGELVWMLNSDGDRDGCWRLAEKFSLGWPAFTEAVIGALIQDRNAGWHRAWAEYWRRLARRRLGASKARQLPDYHRAKELFIAGVLHDLVVLWRAGCRLSRCRFGHLFFSRSRRGPLPRVCPIHWPLANQERVHRQRHAKAARTR